MQPGTSEEGERRAEQILQLEIQSHAHHLQQQAGTAFTQMFRIRYPFDMDPDPRIRTAVARADPDPVVYFSDCHDTKKKYRKFFPEFFAWCLPKVHLHLS